MGRGISAKDLHMDFDKYVDQDYLYYPRSIGIQIMHCMDGTGNYFRIYRYEEQIKEQLEVMRKLRLENAEIHETDKLCSFYRTEYMNNTLIPYREEYLYEQDLGLAIQRLTDSSHIIDIYNRILEYKPVWLRAEADIVAMLIKCREAWGMPLIESLRYLEVVNDWTGITDISKTEKIFSVHIENVYTFSWCGDFAYGRTKERMEILKSSGNWEIFSEQEYHSVGKGELVISMEGNGPMPLKRFHTGYVGEILENSEKGKKFISINLPDSKKMFYRNGETALLYDVLTNPVEKINETIGNIIWQCQVKMIKGGYEADLHLRPSYSGWRLEIEKLYREELQAEKDRNWKFVFHDTYFQGGN